MKVGSDELMEKQVVRLLYNTHVIRLVPASPPVPFAASYVLWEYEKAAPVIFMDSDLAKVFAQDTAAVDLGKSIFQRLDAMALDAGQSRSELMKLVSSPREDRNDLAKEQL